MFLVRFLLHPLRLPKPLRSKENWRSCKTTALPAVGYAQCLTIRISGGEKHALHNSSRAPASVLLTTTPNMCRFFRELGKPFHPGQLVEPPTSEDLQRLRILAAQHNYWMASPQENAAIGLTGF